MGTVWKVLTRKKVFDSDSIQHSQLARVLNTFDLTALGVGSTLGVGVYVIVGHVARDTAGPSVVLSFLIAAIASIFAGLCYAEFGARTPRAGSAYVYSYTCIGEFVAFVIGWNLILEYVIGSASVAKGISVYIDSLANDSLKNAFMDVAPINAQYMADYFDFFSFGISVLLAAGLAFGMKESSIMNNLFTVINVFVVLFVIIAGATQADSNNWKLEADPDSGAGDGGFFPFGIGGMIKGAATCFYAFIGFDCIATTGEEVKNPKKAIPIAILTSLVICFLCYFSSATVVTMMVPFYAQDVNAPLPHAFAEVGLEWAKWVVAIGGIFGLVASLFGAMFPLPRILYAMASDGLIFRFLGIISNRFSAPVVGTLLAGVLTGLMSALFDLAQLVNMMSIGTLLAYTIVAACVLLLRFEADEDVAYSLLKFADRDSDNESYTDSPRFETDVVDDYNDNAKNSNQRDKGIINHIFGCGNQKRPTKFTERLAAVYIIIYTFLALVLGLLFLFIYDDLADARIYAIVLISIVGCLMIAMVMLLSLQPTTSKKLSFKVPLVPFLPALSILINIYLMLMLDAQTWIRFGAWMIIGVPMYIFLRLCCHSKHSQVEKSLTAIHNGDISQNDQIVSRTEEIKLNGVIVNGHAKIKPSAPLEDSSDSGFGSTVALDATSNSADEPPAEIKSKLSVTSVDVVIAELDSVILQGETMQTSEAQLPDRKLSVDTMSNASCLPVEEKVVALVHREDIISEPTTPLINPSILSPSLLVVKDSKSEEENEQNTEKEEVDFSPAIEEKAEEISVEAQPKDEVGVNLISDNLVESTALVEKNEKSTDNENDIERLDIGEDADIIDELFIRPSRSNSSASPPVSIEDLHSERNESDTDIIDEIIPVIPIPPPLPKFDENTPIRIPRASLEKRPHVMDVSDIKLRPLLSQVSKTSETSSSSSTNSVDESFEDNVVFGGRRYAAVAAQLEEMLKNKETQKKLTKPEQHEIELPKQSETLKPVMSQIIGEIVRNSTIDIEPSAQENDSEKVDYKSQSPSDIRGRLEDIFRQPNSFPKRPTRPRLVNETNSNENKSDQPKIEKVQEGVKNNDSREPSADDGNLHKEMMNDIFKTIKLRKLDSFREKLNE